MTSYHLIVKPILFRFSPDTAHRIASFGLKLIGDLPPAKWLARRLFSFEHPSLATLKFFAKRLRGRIPLVSVGGVSSAEDAYERLRAGASLIQLITSWIFEGPGLLKKINQGLVEEKVTADN